MAPYSTMWSSVPNRLLIQGLFMLDNGDPTTYENDGNSRKQYNELYSKETLDVLKKIVTGKPFSTQLVKTALERRAKNLYKHVIAGPKRHFIGIQPIDVDDQGILTLVAMCKFLNISCDDFSEKFKKVQDKFDIEKNMNHELFLFAENVRMIKICDKISPAIVYKVWQKVEENKDLNRGLISSKNLSPKDLELNDGLKEAVFLYLIRHLELLLRLTRIYCHHFETILKSIIIDCKNDIKLSSDICSVKEILETLSVYPVSKSSPGYCLILCSLRNRDGAINEADNVSETFGQLGYKVKVIPDPTVYKIQDQLTQLDLFSTSLYDSFVLWVIAHGEKKYVTMSDGEDYSRKKLIKDFSLVSAFKKKPKVFFMTTCQGGKFIGLESKKGLMVATDAMPIELPIERENLTAVYYEMDRLIAYSTLPEQYSYRNNTLGSYYVDIVCRLLKEEGDRNLAKILEKVTQEMHTITFMTNLFTGKAKQASCYNSTLQKSLILPTFNNF